MRAPQARLPTGGLIDRTRSVRFSFDGRPYVGFQGDTLASALIANGVRLVGRSFKYHRPRGILTAGNEEPNALVTHRQGTHADPNARATTLELYHGLIASSQNRWPGLSFDIRAINQLAAPMLVAGFYYKTFMWPAAFWEKIYEPVIRRGAGLGKLSGEPDPDTYDREHAFCDLLVIGGGPAGLSVALAAGRRGLRVIVVEDDWRLGGRLLSERHEVDGVSGSQWAAHVTDELRSLAKVRTLTRTAVFGMYDGEFAAVERISDHLPSAPGGCLRQRYWKIVAKRAVLATGAVERSLVFGGNDRPGVMMASAMSTYVNRFAAVPGQSIAIFTTTDSGWQTAEDLIAFDLPVAAVIDARKDPPAALVARIRAHDIAVFTDSVVTNAHGRPLKSVDIRSASGEHRRLAADALAMAGGWNPPIGVGCHLGARPVWSDAIAGFLLERPPPGMRVIGAAAGRFCLPQALLDGCRVGDDIAEDLGFSGEAMSAPRCSDDLCRVTPLWSIPGKRSKAFVDFQNDVTSDDIALAAREGFVSVEHLKRYTTLGMGTDQGKVGHINGHALLAIQVGKTVGQVGTVLSRPPAAPVAIAALAGHSRAQHFRPARLTPSHGWALEQGATFTDAGMWKRARWFARQGETDWRMTGAREVTTTRKAVGICDVSTLGKIEMHGGNAARLLDSLYINMMSTLPVGKVRYGVMLREDGFVMDDGTVTRLGEEHFFITTTTANAARVMQHIDFCRQVLWSELDVQAVSVTEQWAQFAVAGPKSRALLEKVLPEVDLSNAALPYMSATALEWKGISIRLYRVSFSGELAYDIGIPAWYGDALVRALIAAAKEFDAAPYGTEALSVMRIEKGHVAGGELNGQTTAGDLGLGRLMSSKKQYVGQVMAHRPDLTESDRLSLVGLKPTNRSSRLSSGAFLLPLSSPNTASFNEGYVTSVAYSPSLNLWIALALVRRGPARIGERLRAHDSLRSRDVEVEVCHPVFIDPEGARLRA